MKTDNFIMKIFPKNRRKLESVENRIRDKFGILKIKQLFHSRLLEMSRAYESRLGDPHLVRYLKLISNARSWNNC